MSKSFDELKVEAKELGVKIFGKKVEVLEKEIEAARLARAANPTPIVEGIMASEGVSTQVAEPAKKTEVKKNFNTVVIYNGKQEIRTYSLAVHGEKFADLATSFATDRGYRMELIDTGKNITCPSCGHSFAPRVK